MRLRAGWIAGVLVVASCSGSAAPEVAPDVVETVVWGACAEDVEASVDEAARDLDAEADKAGDKIEKEWDEAKAEAEQEAQ